MFSRQLSLGQRMELTNNRSTGFDYMRLFLALGVIIWHSVGLSSGKVAAFNLVHSWARPLISLILPLFFALSGFLVAGSLERTHAISTFVGLRLIRIVPALAVESALSALILGPLLTTLPLIQYFQDGRFYAYFLNIIGRIHYTLPGLFLNNPTPEIVNGQLWTVPWELRCYLVLTLLAVVALAKRPVLFLIGLVSFIPAFWFSEVIINHRVIDPGGVVPGAVLVLAFLAGVSFYSLRRVVPWSLYIFIPALTVTEALFIIPHGDFFTPIPAAYCAAYIGLCNPRKIYILRGADYSYGLFLYGYAVQQLVASLGPWTHYWYINLLVTLPIVTLFAAFSWNVVEKPALKLRRHLPPVEAMFAAVGSRSTGVLPARWRPRIKSAGAGVGKLKSI